MDSEEYGAISELRDELAAIVTELQKINQSLQLLAQRASEKEKQ